MTQTGQDREQRLDLVCRSLAHVVGIAPSELRSDTPLGAIGADDVAVLMCMDVMEAFAARLDVATFVIDPDRVRAAQTVGQLSESISWR